MEYSTNCLAYEGISSEIVDTESKKQKMNNDICPLFISQLNTPRKFNSPPLRIGLLPQKERIVFQPSIFRGKLAVKFRGCRFELNIQGAMEPLQLAENKWGFTGCNWRYFTTSGVMGPYL